MKQWIAVLTIGLSVAGAGSVPGAGGKDSIGGIPGARSAPVVGPAPVCAQGSDTRSYRRSSRFV